MAEVVRTLVKQGAKNKAINSSVKEAMALILENRKIKEQERLAKYQKKAEEKKEE